MTAPEPPAEPHVPPAAVARCADCRRVMLRVAGTPAWRRFARAQGVALHEARGLCGRCYRARRRVGTLAERRGRNHPTAAVYEDWLELKAQGYTRRHAAARLGVSLKALEKAISRRRAAAAG